MMFSRKSFCTVLAGAFIFSANAMAQTYEMLIPTYFNPYDNTKWEPIGRAAQKIPVTAIANPEDGPGPNIDQIWTNRISSLKSQGVKVIGYVMTGYGKRSTDLIISDIQKFVSWYDIDGFFFDEFESGELTPQKVSRYQQIISAARAAVPNKTITVVGNPGINADERLISQAGADVIVQYEDLPSRYVTNVQSNWVSNYPASKFADMVYSAPDPIASIKKLQTRNTKYFYATNLSDPNPWLKVANYFDLEVDYLAALNAGQTIDFDLPKVTYTVTKMSRYDRPPAMYMVRPNIIGGAAKERVLRYVMKLDGVELDTKGRLLPFYVRTSGAHNLTIAATTPLGKTINYSWDFDLGENQLPSCTTNVLWNKTQTVANVRATCSDPDGRIKAIRWTLDGVQQTRMGANFTYMVGPDGRMPSLIGSVEDDSGGIQEFNPFGQ